MIQIKFVLRKFCPVFSNSSLFLLNFVSFLSIRLFLFFWQFIKKKIFFKKLNVKPLMTFKSESSAAPFKFSVCQKRVTLAEPGRFNKPQNVAIRIHLLSANDSQGGKKGI